MFVQGLFDDWKMIDSMLIERVDWFYLRKNWKSLRRCRNIYTIETLQYNKKSIALDFKLEFSQMMETNIEITFY